MTAAWYGRLDPTKARAFEALARLTMARVATGEGEPPREHYEAMEAVAKAAANLGIAFDRVQGAELSARYLRDGWKLAAGRQRPFPDDLVETLHHLAMAVRMMQPDTKSPHRPTANTAAVKTARMLALDWMRTFEAWPTIGTGSPFVRYCRAALPQCPSLDKLAAIVAALNR